MITLRLSRIFVFAAETRGPGIGNRAQPSVPIVRAGGGRFC